MDEFGVFFVTAATVWLVLQILAVWRMRGAWRVAAWASAAAMSLALALAIFGVLAGSNLAPIWVVLALPVCLAWIVLLWAIRAAAWAFIR